MSSSQAEHDYVWSNVDANGICFLRSEIRPADVKDGMTHVILVGEKWVPSSDDLSTVSLGYNQPHVSGDCLDVRRFTISAPAQDDEAGRLISDFSQTQPIFPAVGDSPGPVCSILFSTVAIAKTAGGMFDPSCRCLFNGTLNDSTR